mmetsp:Transcript_37825/g.87571  ORF Transcript_37825/g.87571 Transcript_37825/m.87571 type:complete len:404 (+) Transcript_37825:55-1266(+)
MPGSTSEGSRILERYSWRKDALIGEGAWCVVFRAKATDGREVAVKTFRDQASEGAKLHNHFEREVRMFQTLGIGPEPGEHVPVDGLDPRRLLVNLLDFSSPGGSPGPEKDGKFYTVLELGEESLDARLRRESVDLTSFCHVAGALCEALQWLHGLGFVHLDVKPENVMRFGESWKLIDLGSCLPTDGYVSPADFTPLYASPELAKAALAEGGAPLCACPALDMWAAGVVLLDVLVQGCCFAETKAAFDMAALFEEEAMPCEGWYGWLASTEALDIPSLVKGTPGAAILSGDVRQLLEGFLHKEPEKRLSAASLREHPLLKSQVAKGRRKVELAFGNAERRCHGSSVADLDSCSFSADQLMDVLCFVGVAKSDATRLLDAMRLQADCEIVPLNRFLDFLYRPCM